MAVTIHGCTPTLVKPIQVPMTSMETEYFKVELGGNEYELTYRHGIIDEVQRDSLFYGKKVKFYYQGNMATQGIDIRLGDRVIATRQSIYFLTVLLQLLYHLV